MYMNNIYRTTAYSFSVNKYIICSKYLHFLLEIKLLNVTESLAVKTHIASRTKLLMVTLFATTIAGRENVA